MSSSLSFTVTVLLVRTVPLSDSGTISSFTTASLNREDVEKLLSLQAAPFVKVLVRRRDSDRPGVPARRIDRAVDSQAPNSGKRRWWPGAHRPPPRRYSTRCPARTYPRGSLLQSQPSITARRWRNAPGRDGRKSVLAQSPFAPRHGKPWLVLSPITFWIFRNVECLYRRSRRRSCEVVPLVWKFGGHRQVPTFLPRSGETRSRFIGTLSSQAEPVPASRTSTSAPPLLGQPVRRLSDSWRKPLRPSTSSRWH